MGSAPAILLVQILAAHARLFRVGTGVMGVNPSPLLGPIYPIVSLLKKHPLPTFISPSSHLRTTCTNLLRPMQIYPLQGWIQPPEAVWACLPSLLLSQHKHALHHICDTQSWVTGGLHWLNSMFALLCKNFFKKTSITTWTLNEIKLFLAPTGMLQENGWFIIHMGEGSITAVLQLIMPYFLLLPLSMPSRMAHVTNTTTPFTIILGL